MSVLKKLPESIMLRRTVFADGANGMRLQAAENEEFGVRVQFFKKDHDSAWEQSFTKKDFDGEFETYKELREAFNGQNKRPRKVR